MTDPAAEIAPPVTFTSKLDQSERRAIERRLLDLAPYEEEAKALRRRLANVKRRLGVESTSKMLERAILKLLIENDGKLPRSVIVRDLHEPEHVVKAALERLQRQGRIVNPARGYWMLP